LAVAASRSELALQNAALSPPPLELELVVLLELVEDFELLLQAPRATKATRTRTNAARRDRWVCIEAT
jgi:hypothetical protein